MQKRTKVTRTGPKHEEAGILASAAQAIGATLGSLAVKTGIAKAPTKKRAAPRRATAKTAVRKAVRKVTTAPKVVKGRKKSA
jgi:hypothetical protein